MNPGNPINAWLDQQAKTKYSELKEKLINAVAKKKNASKIYTICQKFCFFNLETELIPTLLSLLSHNDNKLTRIVYYFLGTLAASHNERNRFQSQLVEHLKADMTKGPTKQIMCIRAFSGYIFSEGGRPITLELVRKIMRGEEENITKDSKGKSVDLSLVLLIKSMVFFELQSRLQNFVGIKEIQFVLSGLSQPLEPMVRSSLNIISTMAKTTPKEVVPYFKPYAEQQKINFQSNRILSSYLALCGFLAPFDDFFRTELILHVASKDILVSYAAMENLLKLEWKSFDIALSTPIQTSKTVVDLLVTTLVQALANPSPPIQHAACRLCRTLGESYVKHLHSLPKQSTPEHYPLAKLHFKLNSIIPSVRSWVAIQALRAIIWVTAQGNEEELLNRITNIQLPPEMFGSILDELLERVKTTPEIATTALQVIHSLFITNPSKINEASLVLLWRTVMNLGASGKAKVVNHIFQFLSSNVAQETQHLHTVAYWMLGEHANEFAGEELLLPKSTTSPKTPEKPSEVKTKRTIKKRDTRGTDADSLSESDSDRRGSVKGLRRPSKKTLATSHSSSNLLGEVVLPKIQFSLQPLLPNLPPLSNPVMKLILMKLETSLMNGSPATKANCLRGLIKIAFSSNAEVKIHLYCLFTVLTTGILGAPIANEAAPVVFLLSKILDALEAFTLSGVNLSEDQRKKLNSEIKAFLPNLPADYHPFGHVAS